MVQLSIIIPTLNEEKYLPKLLQSIKAQDFEDYEIIVSDGKSKDKTRQIARKFGCKVVDGVGSPGPGRNKGAKIAKGSVFLFLDGDTVLPQNFLKEAIEEFEQRNLDIAFCCPIASDGNFLDQLLLALFDVFVLAVQYVKPFGGGFCLFAKKSLHKKLKGFNEKIFYLEDIDYIQRADKFAKYGVLKPKILLSARRFHIEGRVYTFSRYIRTYLYRVKGKEVTGKLAKDKKFHYRYDYKK